MWVNNNNVFFGFPFLAVSDEATELKNAHDTYDIFVNQEFVGKKSLLGENETIRDIESFLHQQGIEHFSTHLDGDHYVIEANNPHEVQHLKDVLTTYLQNR